MNDLIPYKEIVHLLNGCESNIFKLNENFWNRFDRNLFFNQLLEPQEVEQIKRIGSIALQYSHIQKFLDQPTGTPLSFRVDSHSKQF